jgi:hypothetical protein
MEQERSSRASGMLKTLSGVVLWKHAPKCYCVVVVVVVVVVDYFQLFMSCTLLQMSVHEDMKWYSVSVQHVISFLVLSQFLYYYCFNNLRLIQGIYIVIVLGIVLVL